MDTLTLALALLTAHDTDRAMPVSTPMVRSAQWEVRREVSILPPPPAMAMLTRDPVKVAEPTEITFHGKGE